MEYIIQMKTLLLIFIPAMLCSYTNILPESEYTNTIYSRAAIVNYIHSITKILTIAQIDFIIDQSYAEGVSPVVVFATLQKESSMVEGDASKLKNEYKAMGYHALEPRYHGFSNQVVNGIRCLKYHFINASNKVYLYDFKSDEYFTSKADYALYKYTPRWYEKRADGWSGGNYFFKLIYDRYSKGILDSIFANHILGVKYAKGF